MKASLYSAPAPLFLTWLFVTVAHCFSYTQVGIGTTAPDRKLHAEVDDATSNAVTNVARFTHTTSGTPAAGIGAAVEFEVETAAANNEVGAIIQAVTTDVTNLSEDFDIRFFNMAAGAAASETMRITSTGAIGIGRTSAPLDVFHLGGGTPTDDFAYDGAAEDAMIFAPSSNSAALVLSSGVNGAASVVFDDRGANANKKIFELSCSGYAVDATLTVNSYTDIGGSATFDILNMEHTGDVGVGAAPSYQLHVAENAAAYAAYIFNDGNATSRQGLIIQCGEDAGSGTNTLIDFRDGDGTSQGGITFVSGTVSYNAFTGGHAASLADNNKQYAYGTLMCVDKLKRKNEGEWAIEYVASPCKEPYQHSMLGAYSAPRAEENQHQIYVLGDGHILVNGRNGDFEIGDPVTSSSVEGIGMKANGPGMIIGYAQENHKFRKPENTYLIAVQYGPDYYSPASDEMKTGMEKLGKLEEEIRREAGVLRKEIGVLRDETGAKTTGREGKD